MLNVLAKRERTRLDDPIKGQFNVTYRVLHRELRHTNLVYIWTTENQQISEI